MDTSTLDFGYIIPEGCVALAPHIRDASGQCTLCHTRPIWGSYQEYVDHFYAFEYEGDRHHVPDSELLGWLDGINVEWSGR